MLNQDRLRQLQDTMAEHGWDFLLLYGHAWRKDFFRCLLNVNFLGPHAAVAVARSGELHILVSHPWDVESLSPFGQVTLAADFVSGLYGFVCSFKATTVAIAGMELLEASFVHAFFNPISATFLVEELRRVKTASELESLKKAADLADRGYQHFAQVIEEGMAEFELVAEVESFLKTNGAEDNFMLIASGGVEVTGMRPPTARRFQKGDSVTTELTPQVNGYFAQICRTLVLGEPNPQQQQAFSIFSEARQAAEDLLKPGVNVSTLARAQNDVFRKYGYGEYTGPKYTRVRGHGLGLHPDENPYILEDVDYVVKKDMILIAHPNTYLPLSGYMVFGDTLHVTASGCTSLNRAERKLFQKEAG
jgi:Xaa-Pro dipeptidase